MAAPWYREVFTWPSTRWTDSEYLADLSPECLGFSVIETDVMEEIYNMTVHGGKRDESFALFDVGIVIERFNAWKKNFPDIKPFYAVKTYDDPAILRLLAYLGTGFDCASKAELELVYTLGTDPSDIIFANTIKFPSHLEYATSKGIDLMTFDNEEELRKIKKEAPNARLLLRIAPQEDGQIQLALNNKFGCAKDDALGLLIYAESLELNVSGVCFHSGSGIGDAEVYINNIKRAKYVFDVAAKEGMSMDILDIGGGFFGYTGAELKLQEMSGPIKDTLKQLFPKESGVEVMAEPGRFFVEGAMMMAVCVIGKRINRQLPVLADSGSSENDDQKRKDEVTFEYYISESMFGSISHHYRYLTYNPRPLIKRPKGVKTYKTKLWGPSCTSVDVLAGCSDQPELSVGEWLIFPDIGSYSVTEAGTFNGLPLCPVRRVMKKSAWERMCQERSK